MPAEYSVQYQRAFFFSSFSSRATAFLPVSVAAARVDVTREDSMLGLLGMSRVARWARAGVAKTSTSSRGTRIREWADRRQAHRKIGRSGRDTGQDKNGMGQPLQCLETALGRKRGTGRERRMQDRKEKAGARNVLRGKKWREGTGPVFGPNRELLVGVSTKQLNFCRKKFKTATWAAGRTDHVLTDI